MNIWLFDIDGTLITTGGAGRLAMAEALHAGFGCPADTGEVPFAGRTDRAIARDLFHLHGIDDSPESWQLFQQQYLRQLDIQLARCQGEVLPGVDRLLGRLAEVPQTLLGLLTGNTPEGARRKLRYYGLWGYFRFGAYGDRCCDRNEVAAEACRIFAQYLPDGEGPGGVWVVGDTPHDIRCARAIGARAIGVATGSFSRDQLAAHLPDRAVDRLDQLDLAWCLESGAPGDGPADRGGSAEAASDAAGGTLSHQRPRRVP